MQFFILFYFTCTAGLDGAQDVSNYTKWLSDHSERN